MEIRTEAEGTANDVARIIERELLKSLAAENEQAENTSLVLSARAEDGRLIGGLTASTSYGWLLIKTLWVDDQMRGQGIGRQLMESAEAHGRAMNCHGCWLDTSSAEAEAFYTRLGFKTFGELANTANEHPAGHCRWFMKRVF